MSPVEFEPGQKLEAKAVRDERHKLVLKTYYRGGPIAFRRFAGPKLFGLAADPTESHDIGNRRPEVFERLMRLATEMEAVTGPMAVEPDPLGPSEGAPVGPVLDGR